MTGYFDDTEGVELGWTDGMDEYPTHVGLTVNGQDWIPATPQHAAQLLLSHIENNNDKRQSIDPSGHCVKLIHGLRAIAEEGK